MCIYMFPLCRVTGLTALSNMTSHVPRVKNEIFNKSNKKPKYLISPQLLKHLKVDMLNLGLLYTSEH